MQLPLHDCSSRSLYTVLCVFVHYALGLHLSLLASTCTRLEDCVQLCCINLVKPGTIFLRIPYHVWSWPKAELEWALEGQSEATAILTEVCHRWSQRRLRDTAMPSFSPLLRIQLVFQTAALGLAVYLPRRGLRTMASPRRSWSLPFVSHFNFSIQLLPRIPCKPHLVHLYQCFRKTAEWLFVVLQLSLPELHFLSSSTFVSNSYNKVYGLKEIQSLK